MQPAFIGSPWQIKQNRFTLETATIANTHAALAGVPYAIITSAPKKLLLGDWNTAEAYESIQQCLVANSGHKEHLVPLLLNRLFKMETITC